MLLTKGFTPLAWVVESELDWFVDTKIRYKRKAGKYKSPRFPRILKSEFLGKRLQ